MAEKLRLLRNQKNLVSGLDIAKDAQWRNTTRMHNKKSEARPARRRRGKDGQKKRRESRNRKTETNNLGVHANWVQVIERLLASTGN